MESLTFRARMRSAAMVKHYGAEFLSNHLYFSLGDFSLPSLCNFLDRSSLVNKVLNIILSRNCLNSKDTKEVALSDTIVSHRPSLLNISQNASIVHCTILTRTFK